MPEKILVLFSGGKDSLLTADYYASQNTPVILFSCNNGAVAAEKNLLHGVTRLQNKHGKELIQYAGCYLTAGIFQWLNMKYMQLSYQELAEKYPNIIPAQMQCMCCQTSMWISAIAYCVKKGIHQIATGYKKTDYFVTGMEAYIARITGLCAKYNITTRFPEWDAPDGALRDIRMIELFYEPKVLEPKCWLGLPVNKPSDSQIYDLAACFDDTLSPHIDDLIESLAQIFEYIKLTPTSLEMIEYPLPKPEGCIF